MPNHLKNYEESGLDIQHAMLDQAKHSKVIPPTIMWGDKLVKTADVLIVPPTGIVRGEFIRSDDKIEQGFDLRIDGYFLLPNAERVPLLRTWYDPQLHCVVEYPYESRDGRIHVWNIYKMTYPGGQVVEEKWTGNAGCWVEEQGPREKIYHCSHGSANPPDFESFVFKISVTKRE